MSNERKLAQVLRLAIFSAILVLAACNGGQVLETSEQARLRQNKERLCNHSALVCIRTEDGESFRGPQYLIDEMCDTKNTGVRCEGR